MIDLRLLRENSDYRAGAIKKGVASDLIDAVLGADERRRSAMHNAEEARAAQNAASKEIGRANPNERESKIAEATRLKVELEKLEAAENAATLEVDELALQIPNPAHDSVPPGDESNFVTEREVGDRTPPGAYDHAELGELLGIVDSERAVRNSGSRFAYLMGPAVRIEFALVQFAFDLLEKHSFIPVIPPVLVREEMMVDAGFFPTDRHQVYEIAGDDLFLIGTSEVALAGLHRGEHLERESLPTRYAGFSSCFRREAGTYGKDTRGIFRVHQFDKVEMYKFVEPGVSYDELELLVGDAERVCEKLGIQHRVLELCTGDLGFAAAKSYDVEMWGAGTEEWLEVSSCSNCTDFQSRRASIRYRPDGGGRPRLLHTLNGSGLAIPRVMIAIMENFQQEDGSVVIPEVLQPYTGFAVIDKS